MYRATTSPLKLSPRSTSRARCPQHSGLRRRGLPPLVPISILLPPNMLVLRRASVAWGRALQGRAPGLACARAAASAPGNVEERGTPTEGEGLLAYWKTLLDARGGGTGQPLTSGVAARLASQLRQTPVAVPPSTRPARWPVRLSPPHHPFATASTTRRGANCHPQVPPSATMTCGSCWPQRCGCAKAAGSRRRCQTSCWLSSGATLSSWAAPSASRSSALSPPPLACRRASWTPPQQPGSSCASSSSTRARAARLKRPPTARDPSSCSRPRPRCRPPPRRSTRACLRR